MIRLHVVGEGPTEEQFVKDILEPHLLRFQVYVTANNVGGGGRWEPWRNQLRLLLRSPRPELRVTTMVDFYRFPAGLVASLTGAIDARIRKLEQAMEADVGDRRFRAYVQKHEFEALVLARLDALEALVDPTERPGVAALRAEVGATAPEEVDDGVATAPSKRLQRHLPSYRKVVHGPLALAQGSLAQVRSSCPRFDGWLAWLEQLGHAV